MKTINKILKVIQFILAVIIIVSTGWYLIEFLNIGISPLKLFIYSFLGFIILGVITYFSKEKH